jgi:membrane-associated phospholipid phosphatase
MKRSHWISFIIVALSLSAIAAVFIQFLAFHEVRAERLNWMFDDPVYHFLPVIDASIVIFSITYGSLFAYLLQYRKTPHAYSLLMTSYAFILLMRMATLSLVPLVVHSDLIYLEDPFLNDWIYPSRIVTDLFFSGHTALVFAIYLLSGRKCPFLVLSILIGLLLVMQRVHYSIDVLAAFPFAWCAVYLSRWIGGRVFEK